MRIKMLLITLLLLFCMGSVAVMAQADTTRTIAADSLIIRYDSTSVVSRAFDATQLERHRADPDFIYEDLLFEMSWWQRFKLWIAYWISWLFSREGANSVLKNVIIALGVLAILYLILRLLGMDMVGIFGRKPKNATLPYQEFSENIHELDFEAELQQAVSGNNFRLATRLLYLRCLKTLSDLEHIDWQPGKTNADYANELPEANLKPDFRQLTRIFEFSWYGDLPVDGARYEVFREAFARFDKEVRP